MTVLCFVPAPPFSYRVRRKQHPGPCPHRGHCTVTVDVPGDRCEQKGNSKRIVRRGAHAGIAAGAREEAAEDALVAALLASPDRPSEPLGACELGVTFRAVPPASWPDWRREAALAGAIPCTSHGYGDRGNLLKLLEDCLQAADWITDDCGLVGGPVAKRWASVAGYALDLRELPAAPRSKAEWLAMKQEKA